jgi:hypothetical protein
VHASTGPGRSITGRCLHATVPNSTRSTRRKERLTSIEPTEPTRTNARMRRALKYWDVGVLATPTPEYGAARGIVPSVPFDSIFVLLCFCVFAIDASLMRCTRVPAPPWPTVQTRRNSYRTYGISLPDTGGGINNPRRPTRVHRPCNTGPKTLTTETQGTQGGRGAKSQGPGWVVTLRTCSPHSPVSCSLSLPTPQSRSPLRPTPQSMRVGKVCAWRGWCGWCGWAAQRVTSGRLPSAGRRQSRRCAYGDR